MGKGKSLGSVSGKQRVNEQIHASTVRVISAEGQQLGIMPTVEALEEARKIDLDLVEVASSEEPPVCRIMDYGKYKYQQKKRAHHKNAHHTKIKEIRVRPKTSEHDIKVKVNKAREFLEHKDKVIVTVVFRGREYAHIEEGQRVINGLLQQLEDISKVESPPEQHQRRLTCTLAPK